MRDGSSLDEMLASLDMEQYLDFEGIEYKHSHGSSGPQLHLKECPSCGHDDWKVYMNEETGLGNCFHGGCDMQTFNKWKFLAAVSGLTNNREIYGYITKLVGDLGWRPKRVAKKVNIESTVALPKSTPLPDEYGKNINYLLNRNVNADLCRYFHLRYCDAGAFAYKLNGEKKYQDYSKRIIIPIFDLSGELTTFQGRDVTGNSELRYLFPPGLPATSDLIYNGHNAIDAKEIVVGEGVFDVIGMKRCFDNENSLKHIVPVGTFGMHLSAHIDDKPDQYQKFMHLRRYGLERVTFMWDSEPKAIKAAKKAAEMLARAGLQALIAVLPKGMDPGDAPDFEIRKAYFQAFDVSTTEGQRKLIKLQLGV